MGKKYRSVWVLLVTALLFGLLVGNWALAEEPEAVATLYADMTLGASDPAPESIMQFEYGHSGELTVEMLAEGLTALTGLDFFVQATEAEDGVIIDWAADSTLIANLDDREQKEEFFLYDADSMRWFMMDSLWQTVVQNLSVENIYFTMAGGQTLSFEELNPVRTFPSDIPYMGSAFYQAHANVQGDDVTPSN